MDMIIPPLTIKIMLESDPLKSTILVRRLAVTGAFLHGGLPSGRAARESKKQLLQGRGKR